MNVTIELIITKMFPLVICFFMSLMAYHVTYRIIPKIKDMFIKSNLYGIDLNKVSSQKM